MAKETKDSSEQLLHKEVTYQLEHSMGKLKNLLGEKKFNSRVRKAVKLLIKGIKETEKKPEKESSKINPTKKGKTARKLSTKLKVNNSPAKVSVKKAPAKKSVNQDKKEYDSKANKS